VASYVDHVPALAQVGEHLGLAANGVAGPSEAGEHPGSIPGAHPTAASAAAGPAKKAPAGYSAFTQQYRQDFGHWNSLTGNKGYLTNNDINKLMQDPSIKGNEAAALGSVRQIADRYTNMAGTTVKFTAHGASATNTSGGAGGGFFGGGTTTRTDSKLLDEDKPDIGQSYLNGQQKTAETPHTLFANGKPDWQALKQGGSGDCYWMSTLDDEAKADPNAIKNMIHDNQNGSYTVNFKGTKPVTVQAPTDAEIAAFGGSGKDGLWGSVMEKAYGQSRINNFQNMENPGAGGEPFEGANFGGQSTDATETLTGHKANNISNHLSNQRYGAQLQSDLQHHDLLVASTQGAPPFSKTGLEPDGLPYGHDLSVIGFNPKNDEVEVRNPWGSNGYHNAEQPKDAASLVNGQSGIFWMKLNNFRQDMPEVSQETSGKFYQAGPVATPIQPLKLASG
jgi:hypothetical protein